MFDQEVYTQNTNDSVLSKIFTKIHILRNTEMFFTWNTSDLDAEVNDRTLFTFFINGWNILFIWQITMLVQGTLRSEVKYFVHSTGIK